MSTLKVSMCVYQSGEFDLFLVDGETGEEVAITGTRTFTDAEQEFFFRLMPGCVFTTYKMLDSLKSAP